MTKASHSGAAASGTLTVTDGTHTAHVALVGNYKASTFTVSSDRQGGTTVVDPGGGSQPLVQAMAGFHEAPPHRAVTPTCGLPRLPILHAQA